MTKFPTWGAASRSTYIHYLIPALNLEQVTSYLLKVSFCVFFCEALLSFAMYCFSSHLLSLHSMNTQPSKSKYRAVDRSFLSGCSRYCKTIRTVVSPWRPPFSLSLLPFCQFQAQADLADLRL